MKFKELLFHYGAACRRLVGNMCWDKFKPRPLHRPAMLPPHMAIIWATCWQTFQLRQHLVPLCSALTSLDPFLRALLTTALFLAFL